jgi:hypothetical protein
MKSGPGMAIKKQLRAFCERAGYEVFRRDRDRFGYDPKLDIRRLS